MPLLHQERIDVNIRQFCDAARARFESCASFDDQQHFLVDYL